MTEQQLNDRLDDIQARLQWIADTEARAAWIKGFGANGEFDDERTRLIDETDRVLNELQKAGGSPQFKPK